MRKDNRWLSHQWTDPTTFGLAEILILLHALAGLCIGGVRGLRYGVLVGVAFMVVGGCVGWLSGFVLTYAPQLLNWGASRIFSRHPFAASILAASGYLLWLGVGCCYWTLCFWLLSH